MRKLPLLVKDETSTLEVVVLGNPIDFGGVPSMEYAYDPKSKEHIVAGTFPIESDLIKEMEQFRLVCWRDIMLKFIVPRILKITIKFSRETLLL